MSNRTKIGNFVSYCTFPWGNTGFTSLHTNALHSHTLTHIQWFAHAKYSGHTLLLSVFFFVTTLHNIKRPTHTHTLIHSHTWRYIFRTYVVLTLKGYALERNLNTVTKQRVRDFFFTFFQNAFGVADITDTFWKDIKIK